MQPPLPPWPEPGSQQPPVSIARGDDPGAQLALIQEAMGIITWLWDPGADRVRWYGDPAPLMGSPRGSFNGSCRTLLDACHPDDRAAALAQLQSCLDGVLPSFRVEARVVWPDGGAHWLEVYGRAVGSQVGAVAQLSGVIQDITDRKRVEAAATAGDARFRLLIEESPMAVGMSRGDVVVYGNPSFQRLFGLERMSEVIGRPVLDLVAPRSRADFVARSLRRQHLDPVDHRYEMVALRRDGGEFECEVSVTQVAVDDEGTVMVFVQDVSGPRRMLAALQEERDRANQYLQVAECVLIAFDEGGRVTLLNRKGHQVLGYEDGELLGQDWFAVCLPAQERDDVFSVYQSLMAGRLAPFEYHENHVLTKAGDERYIAWRNSLLIDPKGRIRGTLSAGEDITERHRAEQEIRALNATLERRVAERTVELEASNAALAVARDLAEAATRAKSDFLANMSHEIRTPMNAVLGLTALALRHDDLHPKVQSHLRHVKAAGDALLRIINDILDFSKIESGKLDIEADEFDLQRVFDQLTAVIGLGATEKGLDFVIGAATDVPARLIGDPLRLGQVLLNLCSNAVKFTERGEVVLTVKAESRLGHHARLQFSVRDTGIGMDATQLRRLFRPFGQLDASTTRRFGGTGLGLAICKQLVELMGGEIGARSEPGKGSEFRFTLDFDLPAEAPAPVRAAFSDCAENLAGRRLLLVEDNELNRIVATELLAGVAGAIVDVAENGFDAVDRVRRGGYHLVLMDVEMPGMDGYEAAATLRRDRTLASLPIIAMTAHAMASDRERCLAAGMNDVIVKPYEPRALFSVVARWLRSVDSGGLLRDP